MRKQLLRNFHSLIHGFASSRLKWVHFIIFSAVLFSSNISNAQIDALKIAKDYLNNNQAKYKIQRSDVENLIVTDQYKSKHNGVTHVYLRQTYNGIEVYNANIQVHISKSGKVLTANSNIVPNISSAINTSKGSINQTKAVEAAAQHLNIEVKHSLKIKTEIGGKTNKVIVKRDGVSRDHIPVKLIYVPLKNGKVRLAWDLVINEKKNTNWWNIRVDAVSGEVISKNNWTNQDHWGEIPFKNSTGAIKSSAGKTNSLVIGTKRTGTNQYNVFPMPLESPNHGDRELVASPFDVTSSPFGWHDTDGAEGAEYTITRGNNVHAYEDRDGNNQPGYSPDGGSDLNFDFNLDFNFGSIDNQDAAITNLFYWNNIIHDVLYKYGFDEQSGNFQETNYNGVGIGNDYVHAEAQDGGGLNNANFATPPDGSNPRMQMFLWGPPAPAIVALNSPSSVAGTSFTGAVAGFGADFTESGITGNIVLYDDGTSEACDAATNASELAGNIALIDRGSCEFGVKVLNAENAGAIAVIVCNNQSGDPITMGAGAVGDQVTIPSLMLSQSDCQTIKDVLSQGVEVSITKKATTGPEYVDGDFDNGIVAHEYGHGVSNRLTGGPSNASCLGNAEQMGEGWSDFIGLMLTMREGDTRNSSKGIGTFATGEPTTGNGIRPAPYSTDFNINGHTYASVANVDNISQPHGIGFVWATMLWEMTWDLIDQYGFDPDFYNGTGGNNIAFQLVMDGMKLQPCNPGFIDGRDAILLADKINNDGANQALIWNAFARRGLGFSADQGSSASRTDQTEAFDLPDLTINGSLDVNSVIAGNSVTVSIDLTSFITTQSNVTVTAEIPEGTSYVDASASNEGGLDNGQVVYPSFNMGLDENTVRTFQYSVPENPYTKITSIDRLENGTDNWESSGTNNTWENKSWTIGEFSQYSGLASWYATNTAAVSHQILNYNESLTITETSGLSFWHFYDTEGGWDGGIVEISIDGGTSWEDLGDKMLLNGYNSALGGGNGNEIANMPAFSGQSNGHVNTIVDLSAYAGETALIRFRFGEDDNTGSEGWAIDDVAFVDLVKLNNRVCVSSDETAQKCVEKVIIVERGTGSNTLPTLTNIDLLRNSDQTTAYTFNQSIFLENFNDDDFDFMSKIKIISLPSNGTLTLNGNAVNANDEIAYTEIGNLEYEPSGDGTIADSFEWNAYDGFGYASANATFDISINSAPVVSNFEVDYNVELYSFSLSDFEANYTDSYGGTFTSVIINSLPSYGRLRLDGRSIAVGEEIAVADIEKLTYSYTSGGTLTDDITYSGFDGIDYSLEAASVTLALDQLLSINDEFLVKSSTIYPNPILDEVNVKIENDLKEGVTIRLINSLGQQIDYRAINKNSGLVEVNFNMQNLPMGIYLVQIKQGDFISTQKIFKK